MLRFLWILIIWMAVGCTSLQLDSPPPSPQPIRVSTTPVIFPVHQELLNYCSIQNPEINMILDIQPDTLPKDGTVDIAIIIGEPETWDGITAYQLGWEDIVFITNVDSKVNLRKLESIRGYFTATQPIYNIWTYPQGHPLQKIFGEVIMGEENISPYAIIAPNPGEMLDAITQDSNAIGYIPGSWLTDDIKTITIDPSIQEALRKPILALTSQKPDPLIQNFLACLQINWDQNPNFDP